MKMQKINFIKEISDKKSNKSYSIVYKHEQNHRIPSGIF